jgi:hypothetical protein
VERPGPSPSLALAAHERPAVVLAAGGEGLGTLGHHENKVRDIVKKT